MSFRFRPSQTLILFITVSFLFSFSIGVMGVIAGNTFAHDASDIHAYMGTSIEPLTDAQLTLLGTPSAIICPANTCIQKINTDGSFVCAGRQAGYDIYGFGECEERANGEWKCSHSSPDNNNCNGDWTATLDDARDSAGDNCCPEGTEWDGVGESAKQGDDYKGYHCKLKN